MLGAAVCFAWLLLADRAPLLACTVVVGLPDWATGPGHRRQVHMQTGMHLHLLHLYIMCTYLRVGSTSSLCILSGWL